MSERIEVDADVLAKVIRLACAGGALDACLPRNINVLDYKDHRQDATAFFEEEGKGWVHETMTWPKGWLNGCAYNLLGVVCRIRNHARRAGYIDDGSRQALDEHEAEMLEALTSGVIERFGDLWRLEHDTLVEPPAGTTVTLKSGGQFSDPPATYVWNGAGT